MAKQLNVNLAFTADTSKAKASLNDLSKQLDKIVTTRSITVNDASLNEAKRAAFDLQHHLEAAVNVNTGKLDLGKFSASLKKSGQDLGTLYNKLSAVGPTGQQAFMQLARSIAQADASAITLGTKLGGLLTTLKNTARWQISSSILHGFMGAIQGAYGYAQDLNKSLNNIRIVTGQNIDQMSKFANEANRAAKALSTSTLSYTDAALIYYQQGIRDQAEIAERTTATIKMANVSRQSAQEVSSQMTAIWNNFADGSKSLEYYADAITALGAATASSSSQIASGLQKFAAVADTVGLSYEKATAALATVVAKTQQSEEVVGTAFKTILARIQDLDLGETLDDGVTLGKYAAALKVVGVNVLDTNDHLKEMDTILDDLGNKWGQISEAQRVSLAETVAGTRQYAQFMALMNNYQDVLKNQVIAEDSEGTLQKQQDIYAESWEAASMRVKASMQTIYEQLINDDAFISLLNGISKVTDFVGNLIDNLGGLKGILLIIGTIFMTTYAQKVPDFINKVIMGFNILTGQAEKNRQMMLDQVTEITNRMKMGDSAEVNAQILGIQKLSVAYADLAKNKSKMSNAQILEYENYIKELEVHTENAAAIGKEIDELTKKIALLEAEMRVKSAGKTLSDKGQDLYRDEILAPQIASVQSRMGKTQDKDELTQLRKELDGLKKQLTTIDKIKPRNLIKGFEQAALKVGKMTSVITEIGKKTNVWQESIKNVVKDSKAFTSLKNEMQGYVDRAKEAGIKTDDIQKALDGMTQNENSISKIIDKLATLGDIDPGNKIGKASQELNTYISLLSDIELSDQQIEKLKQHFMELGYTEEQAAVVTDRLKNATMDLGNSSVDMGAAIGQLGSFVMQTAMAINALKNIGRIWSDDDISTGEKLLQTFMSLGMILPVITTLTEANKRSNLSNAASRILMALGIGGEATAHATNTVATEAENVAKTKGISLTYAAMPPLLLLTAIILALIAVIWLIVKAAQALSDAYNKDAIAAERAADTAEHLKEKYEETKQAYDDLKASIEDYHKSVDALDNLTKGTLEFSEAVATANEKAMELINTYSSLQGKYHINANTGLIEFDEGALEDIQREQFDTMQRMYGVSQQAQLNAKAAANKANVTDLSRRKGIGWGEGLGALLTLNTPGITPSNIVGYVAQSGINLSENKGSIGDNLLQSGLGMLTGGIGNFGYGLYRDYEHQKTVIKAVKELTSSSDLAKQFRANQLNDSALMQGLGINDRDLIQSIKEAAEAINKNTDAQEATANQIADQNLRDENGNLLYNQAAVEFASEAYEKANKDIYDAVIDASHGYNKAQGKADLESNAHSIWNRYLAAIGADSSTYHLDSNAIRGSDSNRTYAFRIGTGEVQEITEEEIATTIAASEAIKKLGEAADDAQQTLNNLSPDKLGNLSKDKFQQVIASKSAENLTKDEQDALIAAVNSKGGWQQYLQSLGFSPEAAKLMGEELAKSFTEVDFSTIGDSLTDTPKKAFKAIWDGIAGDLTAGQGQGLAQVFEDTFVQLGTVGLNALSSLFDNLSTEQSALLAKTISTYDWNTGSTADFIQSLTDVGFILGDNTDELEKYAAAMIAANIATKNATSEFKDISKALKDLKSNNGLVDDDTYKKLFEQDWPQYFTTMADGTHQLIGDAETFYNVVHSSLQENFKNALTKNQKEIERVRAQGGFDLNAIRGNDSNRLEDRLVHSQYGSYMGYKVNTDIVQDQLTLLNILDNKSAETAEFISHAANSDWWSADNAAHAKELQDYINGLDWTQEQLESAYNTLLQENQTLQVQLAATAESLGELDYIVQDNNLNNEAYNDGLMTLAAQFENAADESRNFALALGGLSKQSKEEAESELRLAIRAGELANTYDLEADVLEHQAKLLKNSTKYQDLSAESAANLAAKNQRVNRGVKTLYDNFADWKNILLSTNKLSMDYAETSLAATEAIADLTGAVDAAHVPADFLEDINNISLLEKAAQGDADAIRDLGFALAEAQLNEISENFDVTTVLQGVENLKDAIANGLTEQSLGEALSNDWIEALNTMAEKTHMTVEEMNGFLNELGVDIPVTTTKQTVMRSVPQYKTHHKIENRSGLWNQEWDEITETSIIDYKDVPETIEIAAIGKDAKVTYVGATGGGGISPSSTTGSGKSSSSKSAKTENHNNDEAERYHVINKQIASLTDSYKRLGRARDQAYGADKIAIMKQESENLEKQIRLQKEYTKQAKQYTQADLNTLVNGKANGIELEGKYYNQLGLSAYGITPEFDDDGNITNYEAIWAAMQARYNSAVDRYNALSPEEQEADKQLIFEKEQLKAIQDALKSYEDSHKEYIDSIAEEEEKIAEQLEKNNDILKEQLQRRIDILNAEKRRLEFTLKEIGDDVYKTVEAIQNIFSLTGQSQIGIAVDTLSATKDFYDSATTAFQNGDISAAAYAEDLKEVRDNVYENLEAILDLKGTMEEYYSNTLEKLKEKVTEVTEAMSHQASVVEHLKTLLELTGRSTDYAQMGRLLEASEAMAKNQADASSANYESQKRLLEQRQKEYQEAMENGGAEEQEIAKKNLKAQEAAFRESEEQMLSDLEAYIEASNAVIANATEAAYKGVENLYTDGIGWDYLNQSMELQEAASDRYLTKTNQLYEMDKMRNKLQQDIDKTTNNAAKQRLAAFDKELEAMREKNQLSKNELEIAKAQYELLLAQIALEEAQNAKSIVRLQRDENGNYGYVYTADAEKTAEAEQNVADKQNDLYNLALDQQTSYVKDRLSLEQEFQNAMREIDDNETLSLEEKLQRQEEIRKYYDEQFRAIDETGAQSRFILNQVSAENINGEWKIKSEELAGLHTASAAELQAINETETSNLETLWTDSYAKLANEASTHKDTEIQIYSDLHAVVKEKTEAINAYVEEKLGVSLDHLDTKVVTLTEANDSLAKTLTDPETGVIAANEKLADKVAKETITFGKYYDDVLQPMIDAYKDLIKQIDAWLAKDGSTIHTRQEHTSVTTFVTNGSPVGGSDIYGNGTGNGINTGNNSGPDPITTAYQLKYSDGNQTYTEYFASEAEGYQRYLEIKNQYRWVDWIVNGVSKAYSSSRTPTVKAVSGATGMYTGTWNGPNTEDNGKLAFLHQKELVLNQQDTENMLQAVNLVRQIIQQIDLRAATSNLAAQLQSPSYSGENSMLNQQVTIHADFPNAVDHNEIAEAFETLVNRASQYAARYS